MSQLLAEICAAKRLHIAAAERLRPRAALQETIATLPPPRGFHAALRALKPGLIAEIKRASPSGGLIRPDFQPAQLAKAYAAGGAACLSVLTDAPYFQGDDRYIQETRMAVTLPALRKDFMLEPYQILESRALGADCVLLIMAILTDMQAASLEVEAQALGLDVLVEVHDEAELTRAVTHLRTPLLGINNRNLNTLEVDLATTERLAALAPPGYTLVSESGIKRHADIVRMQAAGVQAFLVGESLMREPDVTRATHTLLGAPT